MSPETSTALVVDGQNLFMRSVFASRHSAMSAQGIPTGPLVLFVGTLAKLIRAEQPHRLVITWDGGTSEARRRRLPSYKADRRPVPTEEAEFRDTAFDLVLRFCALAGLFSFRVRGMEADDLIAGAWHNMLLAEKIVIVSSDKDFLQLLGPSPHGLETEQIRLSSAGTGTDRWDAPRLLADMGVTPAQWPLMTALTGDKGDGVPGLPGIGPVKARKLLGAADWNMNAVPLELAQREVAAACFEVVNLRDITYPTPVPLWRPTRQDNQAWPDLIDFLDAYEMRSLKDQLRRGELWSDRDLIIATESDDASNGRAP